MITAALRSHVTLHENVFNMSSSGRDTHLVLELLTELQGDGEEHQRIIKPRYHTLHLVNMAHLEAVVVELTVWRKCSQQTAQRD